MKGLDRGDWRRSDVGPKTLLVYLCICVQRVCVGSDYICAFKIQVCEGDVGAGGGQRLLMEEAD